VRVVHAARRWWELRRVAAGRMQSGRWRRGALLTAPCSSRSTRQRQVQAQQRAPQLWRRRHLA
jgi:hypothetical protein